MTKYDEPAMALCETVTIRGGQVLHLAEKGKSVTTCGSPVSRRTWFARYAPATGCSACLVAAWELLPEFRNRFNTK
jgi:hypothetical protein